MLRRIALVLAASAATVPFAASSASASCLDDLQTDVFAGATYQPYSDHVYNWVHVQGTATVIVEGDDLIWDAGTLVYNVDQAGNAAAENTPGATIQFVDCVAG